MKKTKLLTRLGAVVFALAILFAMAVPAFADTSLPTGDATGIAQNETSSGVYAAVDPTIKLTKQIVFKNPDSENVRRPNITFTYQMTSASPNADTTVTDSDGDVANVKAGPLQALSSTTASIQVTDATYATTSTNGTAVDVGEASFTFSNLTAFTQPGVYRYKISDTTTAEALTAAGITARTNSYETDRFLDVYVRRNSTSGDMEIYGYVLFEEGTFTEGSSVTTQTEKSNGWVYKDPAETPGGGGDTNMQDVDVYQTYNIKVSKAVTGALADTSHKFPFTVTFANTTETSITKIDVALSGANGQAAIGTVTADSSNNTNYVSPRAAYVTGGIANGGEITITGIPKSTTVDVQETNDTYDEYTASATVAGTAVKINSNQDSDTLAHNAAADLDTVVAVNAAATTQTIQFTNDLSEISPTGLAFRVAPYVLMLTAGVSLIVLFIKRKRETTDMI